MPAPAHERPQRSTCSVCGGRRVWRPVPPKLTAGSGGRVTPDYEADRLTKIRVCLTCDLTPATTLTPGDPQ